MSLTITAMGEHVAVYCPTCGETDTYRSLDAGHIHALTVQHRHATSYTDETVDELLSELRQAHIRMDRLGYPPRHQRRTAA